MKKFTKLFLLFFFSAIAFFSYAIPLNIQSTNWYNQYFPNLNGRPINDITFVDSLIGYAITGSNTVYDTNFILKTTNGGDNWIKLDSSQGDYSRIIFLNSQTGFISGGWRPGISGGYVSKTTNGGINWTVLPNSVFANHFDDMYVLNNDTIWVADDNGFDGGLYRTTNGGNSWIQQYFNTGYQPNKIYFVNRNLGFFCSSSGSLLFRTTNGGFNWPPLTGENGFSQITFIDSLTGWKASSPYMKKTTNGGLNWINQPLPNSPPGYYISGGMYRFSILNKDTIWGIGASFEFPNLSHRGILYRTTNGGFNWQYQIPDTSLITIMGYSFIQFVNKKIGWAYNPLEGIHTINGGDTTFLSNINNQITNNISNQYKLYQNYPNPFNSMSNIKYKIEKTSDIKIIIFDITGKEIETLINKKQPSGNYEVKFNGENLSSGIYFYSLFVNNDKVDTKKMILIK